MKCLALFAVCACSLPLCVSSASAQFPCGDRNDFVKTLDDKYHEEQRALGIANQTNLVELFVSKKSTWTIMVTQPTGKTCIIAAGNSWEDLPPLPARTEPAIYGK